ncbi:MAG TPA: tetratricopeptide repeat protein [Dongiaceae bacterium]|nr:tetratricopeptide repeat protein [Dongiaceae bacterium]
MKRIYIASASALGLVLLLAGCATHDGGVAVQTTPSAQTAELPPPPDTITPMTGAQHAAALNDPVFVEGMGLAKSGDSSKARAVLEQAAAAGNPIADYVLALHDKNGATPDAGKSLSHAYVAALKGYAPAQSFLGNHYERALKVPGNLELSLRWYRFAAMQGEPVGSARLAVALLERQTPQDFTEALDILNRCAQPVGEDAAYRPVDSKGGAPCQSALGFVYLQGMGGVPVDLDQAVRWFQRAADQQQSHAEDQLAALYDQGKGVPKDPAQADYWHRRAQADASRSLDSWTPL